MLDGLGEQPRVADLGAGTGISSRRLAAHGARVLAVEPNAAMRSAGEGDVTWIDGTAEETTLGDASVDGVTAFQAFRWFANDAALAEIRRIVRPGGRACLVRSERDERDGFAAAYGELVRRFAQDATEQRRADSIAVWKKLPGRSESRLFANGQWLDLAGLIGRTHSSSYLPREGPEGERLLAQVRELFARFAADGAVHLALTTLVVRVRLDG